MTAIALLDTERDPHLLADTLLSAYGTDPSPDKRLWLPALGDVPTEWGVDGARFHLVRLARKTFMLPNGSGIVAFAGDCATAFRMWSELSAMILHKSGFDPAYRVNADALQSVLSRLGGDAGRIAVLAMLIDDEQQRTAYVHGQVECIETAHFGTCYVAGSGAQMLERMIRAADEAHDPDTWPAPPSMLAEDLAERLSAEMLHRESDPRNGLVPSSPIDLGCGGFYEWYAVTPEGVRCLQPRLDLHIRADEDGLHFTRLYYVEQLERIAPQQTGVPTQHYFLLVVNLGLEPLRLSRSTARAAGWKLAPEVCWFTVLESAFHAYDEVRGARDLRMDGRLNAELVRWLLPEPLPVHRVRYVLALPDEKDCIGDRLVRPRSATPLATLRAEDDRLVLELGEKLTGKIAGRVWRD